MTQRILLGLLLMHQSISQSEQKWLRLFFLMVIL
nr:MAG TPA: hypothetical protein [Bacteriophage sp.]